MKDLQCDFRENPTYVWRPQNFRIFGPHSPFICIWYRNTVQNSCNLPYFIFFLSTPPPPVRTSYVDGPLTYILNNVRALTYTFCRSRCIRANLIRASRGCRRHGKRLHSGMYRHSTKKRSPYKCSEICEESCLMCYLLPLHSMALSLNLHKINLISQGRPFVLSVGTMMESVRH